MAEEKKTIYDVVVDEMHEATQNMRSIVEEFALLKDSEVERHLLLYRKQKKTMKDMGIWQDGWFDYTVLIRIEKSVSEENKKGLDKLVEGIIG